MYRPTAARAFRSALRRSASTSPAADAAAAAKDQTDVLKKGAKRDPELYILLGIMTGAAGLAGFYFTRKPTGPTSEAKVHVAGGSMPWEVEGSEDKDHFKYQYHPGGDPNKAPKNAPSALHSTIVPNVTLPKSLHEQFNKWGKDDY